MELKGKKVLVFGDGKSGIGQKCVDTAFSANSVRLTGQEDQSWHL